ncbi:MAG: hypothetical protein NNA31_05555 [Nitrospira sp.]|nr:hypothetical protein [Nitrospira sp.]
MKVDATGLWKKFMVAGAAVALVAGTMSTPPAANAAGVIKADDDKWISIGMGLRTSFNAVEGASPGGHYSNEFTVDNARILINGKVHKNIGFEFTTECFNCNVGSNRFNSGAFPNFQAGSDTGTASFGGNSSIGLLDAIAKIEIDEKLNLWVGRMLLPTDRNTLNNAFYKASFSGLRGAGTPAVFSRNFDDGAGLYGRDNAATIWGKVHPGGTHLLYAFAVSQGLRHNANIGNSLMYTGRVQLNLLNDEPMSGYYTAGTYYGTAGDIIAVGLSGQHQKDGAGNVAAPFGVSDVTSFAVDIMVEKLIPNNMGVFTFNGDFRRQWARYAQAAFDPAFNDGALGCFCVFSGHSWSVQGLYLIPAKIGVGRFQPYMRYTAVNPLESASRQEWEGGVNYVIDGHNARVAVFYTYGDIRTKGANYDRNATGDKVDTFHVALQLQY